MKLHKSIVILCAHYLIAQQLMATPFAFVTNTGNSSVTPVNLANNTPETSITVGANPLGIAITPNGEFAYVANNTSLTVSIVNTISMAEVGLVSVSQAGFFPFDVAITPNGATVYVTGDGVVGNNYVAAIPTATNVVATYIPVSGDDARGITISPDGTTVYVATAGPTSPGVAIISTATNLQTAFISLPGTTPISVGITLNGNTLYVGESANSTVIPIPVATLIPGTPIPMTPVGSEPLGMAFTPNGLYLYVTNVIGGANNTVVPITIATNTAGSAINLGDIGVQDIAISQDGTRAFVVESLPSLLAVINLADNAIIGTITGFDFPYGIAITPISPPSSFTGFIQQNKFLNVTECILTMQWTASLTTNVVSYQIFRNGALFATIPATGSLLFTAGLSCNDTGAGFTIVSVDSTGTASTPVPLVLVPAPVICKHCNQ